MGKWWLCQVARRWPAGAILGLSLLDFLGKGPHRAVLERDRLHSDTASGSAGVNSSVWPRTHWGTIPAVKELNRKRHSAHSHTASAKMNKECLIQLQNIYLVLTESSMHQKYIMISPKCTQYDGVWLQTLLIPVDINQVWPVYESSIQRVRN